MDALLLYPNGSQYFAERGIDDQAGLSVVGGGALVDQGQPIPAVIADQPRRRVHRQGGTADDQHVRPGDGLHRAHHGCLVQALLVEHHVWLHHPATRWTAGHAAGLQQEVQAVEPAALHAVVPVDGAVELVHRFAPRRLVEPVDVLSHNGGQLFRRLQLRQFPMSCIGPGLRKEHFAAVKSVELLRIPLKKTVA